MISAISLRQPHAFAATGLGSSLTADGLRSSLARRANFIRNKRDSLRRARKFDTESMWRRRDSHDER